jgi:phage major head subunit gpT-like protein
MDREIDEMFMDHLMKYPSEYEMVANTKNFPKGRRYVQAEISGLGQVRAIAEGGRIEFDTPVEGHRKSVEAEKYGLGFQVTEEMLDDDFHDKVSQVAGTLADSAKDKINVEYFSLFNDGNDTHTAWDGQFVFDDHTTLKSGETITNLDSTALSETSLQAAFEYFDSLVDEAGRKIKVVPDMLLVPTELRWTAARLAKQTGGITAPADTAESSGNIMTVNPTHGVVDPWQYYVCRYLIDDNSWFFISKKDHQLYLLWKKMIALESSDDFHTGTRLYKVTTRFKPAAFDYKAVYGSFVA